MTALEFRDDAEKLRFLDQNAEAAARDPWIVQLASALIRPYRPDDYFNQARAIARYVRDAIRYQPDPNRREQLAHPVVSLKRGYDDCDGKASAAVALMRAVGLDARIHPLWEGDELKHTQVRVRWPGSDHALAPFKAPGGWVLGEVTIAGAELGEDPHLLPKNPETGRLPLA